MTRPIEYWDRNTVRHDSIYNDLLASKIHFDQAACCLLGHSQKIYAIKYVRRVTGWGLREAKEYVDAMERFEL